MKKNILLSLIIILLFVGCRDIPTKVERTATLNTLIYEKAYEKKHIDTNYFDLFTLQDITKECEDIKVYIEGDGLAWVTRSVASSDPTPINPVALKLMNLDKSRCKVYIARPCQYTAEEKNCEQKYWTSHRFNAKVIDSFNEALDAIKTLHKNDSFSLIGYSGGAAVALLGAAKRDDVTTITTIAGNLNHEFWTKYHNIAMLKGSLNPIDFTKELEKIPQYHLVGGGDSIIPEAVYNAYRSYFKNKNNIQMTIYKASHTKGWEKSYKDFLYKKQVFK